MASRSTIAPRLGTTSPWSSKATDIARVCGLSVVRRLERAIEYIAARRGSRRCAARRGARGPDDGERRRSTVAGARGASSRRRASRGRSGYVADRRAGAPRATRLGLALAAGRDRVSRSAAYRRARPRSHGCRADDVRAGELRALPAQDLQRGLDDRWRRRRMRPLFQPDPAHHGGRARAACCSAYKDNAAVDRPATPATRLSTPMRMASTARTPRPVHDPRQGRDAQPPHRDLAVSGRRDRLGRRAARRGRDRPRRQAEGGPGRLHDERPARARERSSRGKRPRAAPEPGSASRRGSRARSRS